jgi:radical SAM protein with 4Fe4S-binding SPASM domain
MADQNPYHCLVPWTHLHVWPNGNAYPCCEWNSAEPVGNVHDTSIKEIFNSPEMRALRQNMKNGKSTAGCNRCYLTEKAGITSSKRTHYNRKFAHHQNQKTLEDGTVEEPRIATFDFRFSNLCNLRCRSCGPALSSAWHSDFTKAYGDPGHPAVINCGKDERLWQQVEELLRTVEYIEFAGGEPLIDPRHWDILNRLIEMKRTNVELLYTTNFTNLEYKSQSVLDVWKKFDKVKVHASLDASGPRAEYLRKGTQWPRIENNRVRMLERAPQVEFTIVSTISLFNAWHISDFHLDWVERGLVEASRIRPIVLSFSQDMSTKVMPAKFKQRVATKLIHNLSRIEKIHGPCEVLRKDYQSIVEFMNSEDHCFMLENFKRNNDRIDSVRNESLQTVFPELDFIFI